MRFKDRDSPSRVGISFSGVGGPLNAPCNIFCRRCLSDSEAMRRGPKRKNLKPPGQCIFCPGTHMSKEHFWSTWSNPMLPKFKVNAYVEEHLSHTRKTVLVKREIRTRPGSASSKKLRVVCEDCNNGWMNQVEDLATNFGTANSGAFDGPKSSPTAHFG